MKKSRPSEILNSLLILCGIACATIGLQGFLLSNHLIDGGITGVSMLLSVTLHWPLYLLIPLINLPFVVMGFHHLGPRFAVKSALAILGLALALFVFHVPSWTPDKLLNAVFGGFFLGAGIGLVIRGGAAMDGTEITALLLSRMSAVNAWLRVGDVILFINVLIFITAASILGVDSALYSMLTYLSASKTVNFLLYGLEGYTAVTIVSPEHEAIRQAMIHDLKRSITLYKGAGGVSGKEQDILYCVVTTLEIARVKSLVRECDPGAFIVIHPVSDVEGGYLKRVGFH